MRGAGRVPVWTAGPPWRVTRHPTGRTRAPHRVLASPGPFGSRFKILGTAHWASGKNLVSTCPQTWRVTTCSTDPAPPWRIPILAASVAVALIAATATAVATTDPVTDRCREALRCCRDRSRRPTVNSSPPSPIATEPSPSRCPRRRPGSSNWEPGTPGNCRLRWRHLSRVVDVHHRDSLHRLLRERILDHRGRFELQRWVLEHSDVVGQQDFV